MDPFTLIEQTWWLGVPVALIMGIFLGVNPLALPMLGAAVGFGASGALGARGAGVRLTAAFGAGMVVVYTAVGVVAGSLDDVLEDLLRPYAGIGYALLGTVIVGFGAFLLFKPSAFCAACARPGKKNLTMMGAFAAGIPAGFVNCPACAAIVVGVAASAAALGNTFYSTSVMFALGIGHAGVLVGLTWLITKGWSPRARTLRVLQRVLAIALMALAAYFFYLASLQGLKPGPRLV